MTVFLFIEGRKRFGHSIIFIIQCAINLNKKNSCYFDNSNNNESNNNNKCR